MEPGRKRRKTMTRDSPSASSNMSKDATSRVPVENSRSEDVSYARLVGIELSVCSWVIFLLSTPWGCPRLAKDVGRSKTQPPRTVCTRLMNTQTEP